MIFSRNTAPCRTPTDALAHRITAVLKDLGLRREAGKLPFYGLPYDEAMIESVASAADNGLLTTSSTGIGVGPLLNSRTMPVRQRKRSTRQRLRWRRHALRHAGW